MLVFYALVILLWLPLMIWWAIAPQYFPFFRGKVNRQQIIMLNVVAYLVFFGLGIALIPTSTEQKTGIVEILGFFAGAGLFGWLIAISIKAKKSGNTQPSSQLVPSIPAATPSPQVAPPVSGQNAQALAQMSDQARRRLERKLEQKRNQSNPNKKAKQRKRAVTARMAQAPSGRIATRAVSRAVARPVNPKPTKPQRKEDFELGNDNLCTMTYQKPDGERSVRPVIIKQLKANKYGDWVMWAIDIEDGHRTKSFRVDRIVKLEHNNQKWTKYDDILGIVRTFECLI